MLTSFEVAGFKCFETLKLQNLKRVNVITGSNASGKTALLEAIYLGVTATGAAIQNIIRDLGVDPIVAASPFGVVTSTANITLATYFDQFFRSVFKENKLQNSPKISITFFDSEGSRYDLSVAYKAAENSEAVVITRVPGGVAVAQPAVELERTKATSGTSTSETAHISLNPFGQLQQSGPATPLGPLTYIFGATMNYTESDNVRWFSQLRERREDGLVKKFIESEFPFVSDLEVMAPKGVNGLYASLTDGSRRRVSIVSAGLHKVVSILLASAHARKGIILIDEIENGIFFEKYSQMWNILYKFANNTENQIFVTSHSKECLEALPQVIGYNEDDFCLLRTERDNENGRCLVEQISGAAMKAALEGKNEIRGVTRGIAEFIA